MTTDTLEVELELGPGWSASAAPRDSSSTEALRRMLDATAGLRVSVNIGPTDTWDVSGHQLDPATVDVVMTIGDDVVGHALSLRFGSPDDARRLRARLAAGSLLVAALTVSSIAVGTQAMQHTVTVAPAAVAPAAVSAPFVNRALNADIRSGDIVVEETPTQPFVNRALNADIRSGDIVQEESSAGSGPHGELKN